MELTVSPLGEESEGSGDDALWKVGMSRAEGKDLPLSPPKHFRR